MTGTTDDISAATAAEPLPIGLGKQLFVGPWADDGRDDYRERLAQEQYRPARRRFVMRDCKLYSFQFLP